MQVFLLAFINDWLLRLVMVVAKLMLVLVMLLELVAMRREL